MNQIEKPTGVKLWKKQKHQKRKLDSEVNAGENAGPEHFEQNLSKKAKKKHASASETQVMEQEIPTKKKNKTETSKNKKNEPQSESQELGKNKKVRPDGMSIKEWKILRLNKKGPKDQDVKVNGASTNETSAKQEKKSRKEWKKLKMQNKGKGDNFIIGETLKGVWGELRREDCKPEKKSQLLKQACNLLKGKVKEFTFAHDTVRVLECILAEGAESHRNLLFNELKDDILPLAKSKYGKFAVLKMLKYGTKQHKDAIMKTFHGKVTKLIRHTEAAELVEVAFNECANAAQRLELVQEFYGPTFAYFKSTEFRNLAELFEKEPDKKVSVIKHMKEAILKILDKSVVKHSIVHHVIWQFMSHCDPASRSEVIEALRESVPEILHTKDGSRVAMNCVWFGTLKDRKVIIKAMKTFVKKIAMEEHGHMVLLALFDCVDDTKLLIKHIIKELIDNLLELSQNSHAKKVLIYLLHPRERHYIHPDINNILKTGDGNEMSKKDSVLRQAQLKNAIVQPLLQLVKSNIQTSYTDNAFNLFALVILQHTEGSREEAYKAIADLATEPYTTENKNTHVVENPGSSYLFKQLIIHDKERSEIGDTFSEVLIDTVPKCVFKSWIECNRGAFLLVSLLETELAPVVVRIKAELDGCKKYLSKKNFKGAEILLKKLKE